MQDYKGTGSLGPRIGLITGALGFAGTLLAPLWAQLPGRSASGLVLVAAAAAVLIFGRRRHKAILIGTAVLGLAVSLLLAPALAQMPAPARRTLAVAVLMAAWWIALAIPIPATSLLPLVLFPVLGVMPSGKTAANYANNNIFLFMGGFIIALGIQRWQLHRRIALLIVRAIGTNPSRMVLGFMIASAFLSMWISNTATALMMLPIGLAVIASLREVGSDEELRGFAPALLLGVAYGASLGGIATPIGTPPNISFSRILELLYEHAPSFSFGRWLLAFLPLTVIFLAVAWLILTRVAQRVPRTSVSAGREVIREELRKMGPLGIAERRMLIVFTITAILWITRGDLRLGAVYLPGWAGLLERAIGAPFAAKNLHDATVAMVMAIALFVLPGERDRDGATQALMDWDTAKQLPWGILLLFGGGFALAMAFKESGLSQYLGEAFASVTSGAPSLILVIGTCLLLTFLTEVTSNTATVEVMLPVLAGAAGAMGENPLLIMLPATISASCAFMMPIATPPNAIVFGSGELEMRHMVKAGLILNLVGVVLVSLFFYFASAAILGLDLTAIPDWASK